MDLPSKGGEGIVVAGKGNGQLRGSHTPLTLRRGEVFTHGAAENAAATVVASIAPDVLDVGLAAAAVCDANGEFTHSLAAIAVTAVAPAPGKGA